MPTDARDGPLPMLLLTLTIVTGIIDAVSILSLGHVFVANMTGNLVFTGFAAAGAPGFSPAAVAAALAGFIAGALGGSRLAQRWAGDTEAISCVTPQPWSWSWSGP
jgi:uncharacterized membrane protein YoaK (UPF0700 family)